MVLVVVLVLGKGVEIDKFTNLINCVSTNP